MTKKTKIYDTDTEEFFSRKIVDMGILTYKGSEGVDPVFNIENDYGGGVLSLKSSAYDYPGSSFNFLKFDGSSDTIGRLAGYTTGPSSKGLGLYLPQSHDFSIEASNLKFWSGSAYSSSSLSVNGEPNYGPCATYIKALSIQDCLHLNKIATEANWVLMKTEGSDFNSITLGNDSSGNLNLDFNCSTGKVLNLDVSNGGLEANLEGSLNVTSSSTSTITSDESTSVVKSGSDTTVPVIRAVRSENGFFVECSTSDSSLDRLGGIRKRSLADFDASGSYSHAFYAYRDGTATEYEEGEMTSGLQFTSAAADFAEYFDIDRNYDWGSKSQDLHKPIVLPEGYIVYVKDNMIHKDPVGIPLVVSRSAIVAGNDRGSFENMLSFCGQLRVFVKGPVETGDLLVPMENICVPIKKEDATMSQYIDAIGRAAESSEEECLKKINCLVGIK